MIDKPLEEVKNLIESCYLPEWSKEQQLEYLVYVLAHPDYQGKTVREIFEEELREKQKYEEDFEDFEEQRQQLVNGL